MQQRFAIDNTGLAPELVSASDDLGIASLLESVAGSLRRWGGADSLAFSMEEHAETIRCSARKMIRSYVHKHLVMQRVFDPEGVPYCAECRMSPCACRIGER
jgi:hypothetical protein